LKYEETAYYFCSYFLSNASVISIRLGVHNFNSPRLAYYHLPSIYTWINFYWSVNFYFNFGLLETLEENKLNL